MSSWCYLVAGVPEKRPLLLAVTEACEAYGISDYIEMREASVSPLDRARISIPNTTLDDPELDAESDEPGSGMCTDEYLRKQFESEGIFPVDWAVIVTGSDATDTGSASVYVFDGDEWIDEYHGQTKALGHDAAAYLERYHGVSVDPLPEKHYFVAADRYDPDPDIRGYDPDQTLDGMSDTVEYDVRPDDWTCVAVGADDYEAVDYVVHSFIESYHAEQHLGIIDQQRVFIEGTEPSIDVLNEFVESGEFDHWWTVTFNGNGSESSVDAYIFRESELIDTVEGESGQHGADVVEYLRRYHGIEADPLSYHTTLPELDDPDAALASLSDPDERLQPSYERITAVWDAFDPLDPPNDGLPWDVLRAQAADDGFGETTVLDERLAALDGSDAIAYVPPESRETVPSDISHVEALLDDTYPYAPHIFAEIVAYVPQTVAGAGLLFKNGLVIGTAPDSDDARTICDELIAASREQSRADITLPPIQESTLEKLDAPETA